MNKLKRFLTDSCILFTIFVFILYIAGHALVSTSITITLKTATGLYLCCMFLRVFHNVLHLKKMPMVLRVLIHYLLVVAAAYIGFALIAKIVSNSLQTFIMFAVVTAIYCTITAVIMLITSKSKEKSNEQKEYKSILK